jgi:excisionase family DNA binding protein
MPVKLNGETYYRTSEVCRMVGISRNTLFRWLKNGSMTEVEHRDCRGWRLFTQEQVDNMKGRNSQISTIRLRDSGTGGSGENKTSPRGR